MASPPQKRAWRAEDAAVSYPQPPYPRPPRRDNTVRNNLIIAGCVLPVVFVVLVVIGTLAPKAHTRQTPATHTTMAIAAPAVTTSRPPAPAPRRTIARKPPTHPAATHPAATAPAKAAPKPPPGLPHATYVSKTQIGKDWPFIGGVNDGWVGCDTAHPGAMLFTLTDGSGKTYALNGTALDAGYPQFPKTIWAQDGSTSISPLQDKDQQCFG